MKNRIDVTQWVQVFKDIGLDDDTMDQWHHLFESRHSEAHESFLEWLGLTSERLKEIQANSR